MDNAPPRQKATPLMPNTLKIRDTAKPLVPLKFALFGNALTLTGNLFLVSLVAYIVLNGYAGDLEFWDTLPAILPVMMVILLLMIFASSFGLMIRENVDKYRREHVLARRTAHPAGTR
ncbi:hypothetical protein [Cryobacterium zhongshanensis]|uniref:Uncharacterized protein n=1 Tax=Cryobacterium zhongshanensis TaxID=2928153 RepID=A0AA41QWV1_9MICO|nr:hypothetical protein [Cryobacterium zhongshanensis]MCI4659635.1 hypothetical protein [Cryobacterium zhongshanensis]